jgi:hypothetical protein
MTVTGEQVLVTELVGIPELLITNFEKDEVGTVTQPYWQKSRFVMSSLSRVNCFRKEVISS